MASDATIQQMVAASIFLIVLAATCVIIRFGVSLKNASTLYADDVMSIVALGLLIASFVTDYLGIEANKELTEGHTESDPTPLILLIYRLGAAVSICSGLVSWASKAPIPLLLIRLFGIKRWLRLTAIIALTTTGIAILVTTAWSAAACDSHGTYTTEFASKCFKDGGTGGVINGVFSLALYVRLAGQNASVLVNE
ncbi:hypothetical protein PFICI_07722 [Pestalotiopsis fici W106-1]|uniref:Rhodopsin domain-containing protein n=1 Tax=Pestalotiopsis fici (strain W106-1 / CGMCC3.15140) TaxID=1229662 RepID=W3X233_PESFW|nr:uncharacterized protein PFICI_07722 [Pestalotiopsis fici W106-1]ETS80193.1 hypothetical protein PFICI_07722 [Pestalotiopsis fici W106-1]